MRNTKTLIHVAKKFCILLIILIVIAICSAYLFISTPHRNAVGDVDVYIISMNNYEFICLSGIDYNPLGRLTVINAQVNYIDSAIDVTKYRILWTYIPEEYIYTFWPVVIHENRLAKNKTYRLRVWDGYKYRTIKSIKRNENGGLVFVGEKMHESAYKEMPPVIDDARNEREKNK